VFHVVSPVVVLCSTRLLQQSQRAAFLTESGYVRVKCGENMASGSDPFFLALKPLTMGSLEGELYGKAYSISGG